MELSRARLDARHVVFNQDSSYVSVATLSGFRIYQVQPFKLAYECQDGFATSYVSMLFSSSLVAIVGADSSQTFSSRRVRIVNIREPPPAETSIEAHTSPPNTGRNASPGCIAELNFVTEVCALLMSKTILVVVLAHKFHIYGLETLKLLYTIDTDPTQRAFAALADTLIAYPCPVHAGAVVIFDCKTLSQVATVSAHQTRLSSLALSADASKLATASERGTVIRVFSVADASLLQTLRRGSLSAAISSLSFSPDGTMLAVSSDHGTVHVFHVRGDRISSASSPVTSETSSLSSLLPSVFGVDTGERAFATVHVDSGQALPAVPSPNTVVAIVTADGTLLVYRLPEQSGASGDLTLLAQHSLSSNRDNGAVTQLD